MKSEGMLNSFSIKVPIERVRNFSRKGIIFFLSFPICASPDFELIFKHMKTFSGIFTVHTLARHIDKIYIHVIE